MSGHRTIPFSLYSGVSNKKVGSLTAMLSESKYNTSEKDERAIASPFYHMSIIRLVWE